MTPRRVLVAGIGNIFFGDDGFGVEVVRRLAQRPLPAGVDVVDFGIRGLDLTYALLDGYAATVLVDVTSRGRAPGTLYVIEPSVPTEGEPGGGLVDTHGMTPIRVLEMARALGGPIPRLVLVGCEPAAFGADGEMTPGLSAPVQAAVAPAVALVESLVTEICQGAGPDA